MRRERIDGWRVVENTSLAWNYWLGDRETKVLICGELGHIRHLLWIAAWRADCREDLRRLLASRAGTE